MYVVPGQAESSVGEQTGVMATTGAPDPATELPAAPAAGEPSPTPAPQQVDVVIVGAGLSGIGAAYRLQTQRPGTSYVILESRAAMGGTWDLFRYPGVRSDSDMYTLGYPFKPWR